MMMEYTGGKDALISCEHEPLSVKYDPSLMDCGISEKGFTQCNNSKLIVQNLNIKIVIVSPLKRALQTCYETFKDHINKPKIIVLPVFREMLLSSCDIGVNYEQSKEQFKDFDFS